MTGMCGLEPSTLDPYRLANLYFGTLRETMWEKKVTLREKKWESPELLKYLKIQYIFFLTDPKRDSQKFKKPDR